LALGLLRLRRDIDNAAYVRGIAERLPIDGVLRKESLPEDLIVLAVALNRHRIERTCGLSLDVPHDRREAVVDDDGIETRRDLEAELCDDLRMRRLRPTAAPLDGDVMPLVVALPSREVRLEHPRDAIVEGVPALRITEALKKVERVLLGRRRPVVSVLDRHQALAIRLFATVPEQPDVERVGAREPLPMHFVCEEVFTRAEL